MDYPDLVMVSSWSTLGFYYILFNYLPYSNAWIMTHYKKLESLKALVRTDKLD